MFYVNLYFVYLFEIVTGALQEHANTTKYLVPAILLYVLYL